VVRRPREGRKEGRIEGARELCLDLVKQHHPDIADRAVRFVKACSDVERLREWGLQASQLTDPEFLRLVTEQSGSTSSSAGRRRSPRPSPKAKSKRST
jgi:hypothetical protein